MSKLRLDVDALAIETFDLTPLRGVPAVGTVRALSEGDTLITVGGGDTATMLASCDPLEGITCGGCDGGDVSGAYSCDVTCGCGAGIPTYYAGCITPPATSFCTQYCLTGAVYCTNLCTNDSSC
ncbi:MAG TPA: hypothetical protein VF771_16170 [Longimicrobiaceae bacterium]